MVLLGRTLQKDLLNLRAEISHSRIRGWIPGSLLRLLFPLLGVRPTLPGQVSVRLALRKWMSLVSQLQVSTLPLSPLQIDINIYPSVQGSVLDHSQFSNFNFGVQ